MEVPPGVLCEGCGYDISSLDAGGACPECGRPLRQSLPEHRAGSPWQKSGAWFATLVLCVRSPRRLFEVIRLEERSSRALARRNNLEAGLIILGGALIAVLWNWIDTGRMTGGVQFRAGATITIINPLGIAWAVFALLPVMVTVVGRFAGPGLYQRLYGWPVSRTCYVAVDGHASFAWIVFAITIAPVAIVERPALRWAAHEGNLALAEFFHAVGLAVCGLAVAYVVYLQDLGFRTCRYASNRGGFG
jgi:hypothetical protein